MVKVFINGVESTHLNELDLHIAYLIWWATKYDYLYIPSFEGMQPPQPYNANYCSVRKGCLRGIKFINGRKYEVYI